MLFTKEEAGDDPIAECAQASNGSGEARIDTPPPQDQSTGGQSAALEEAVRICNEDHPEAPKYRGCYVDSNINRAVLVCATHTEQECPDPDQCEGFKQEFDPILGTNICPEGQPSDQTSAPPQDTGDNRDDDGNDQTTPVDIQWLQNICAERYAGEAPKYRGCYVDDSIGRAVAVCSTHTEAECSNPDECDGFVQKFEALEGTANCPGTSQQESQQNEPEQEAPPEDNAGGGGSCPDGSAAQQDGKECTNPPQSCDESGTDEDCPAGYQWCYGGQCVKE
jgi:hypothetical protein